MLLSFRYFFLCHPTPLRSHAFVAMQSIMLAMGSAGQEKLACAIRVEMKRLERSYSTLCCSVSDIFSFVTPPPSVHRHLWQCNHYACDGVCGSTREACKCNKGLKEVIQLYTLDIRVFCPFSPHPPAFTRNCRNVLHYACDGVCGAKEARKCNKGLIVDSGGKLFNLIKSETN